jgi:putative hydrolase of the HAD superfamily
VIEAIVFDLDDTLYVESDFVASGYRAVARRVAAARGVPERDVFYTMMSVFASQGREHVLPCVIERYLEPSTPIAELVAIYRAHTPSVRLLPGYAAVLRGLARDYRLGIITDGDPQVQRNKVSALGLAALVNEVIYTWDYGESRQKPDPFAFRLMARGLGVEPGRIVYVGDNLEKDGRGAAAAGFEFVAVRPREADFANPATWAGPMSRDGRGQARAVENLHQLRDVLSELEASSRPRGTARLRRSRAVAAVRPSQGMDAEYAYPTEAVV